MRLFGATVGERSFVHQRARMQMPWKVILANGCCIGDRANLYSLDLIEVGEGAIVAQEAYVCTGTHDFAEDGLRLQTRPIRIGKNAFVGARAFILPGVKIGEGAIVGACSVVTADVPPFTVNAGNPSRVIKEAVRRRGPGESTDGR